MIALSRVLWDDDAGAPPEGDDMEFRLTYEGPLLGASKTDTRATHKHAIRCHFQRWPAKFGQPYKWKTCLKAASMPRVRSTHGKTSTADA